MTRSVVRAASLRPLPASLWDSWEMTRAVASSSPGAIIAIARRCHGLRQDELGDMAGFSQSAISRLEAGGNLSYDIRTLRIFQSLLNIPANLLGLADHETTVRRSGPTPARRTLELRRHSPLEGIGLGGDALNAHTLLMVYAPAAIHAAEAGLRGGTARIDGTVARQLLVARRVVADADNWLAPTVVLPVVGELYEFVDELRPLATGRWRREVLHVAALYAEFCAWMHLQTGDLPGANAWTMRAMQQAQTIENRDLVCYTYRRMSQIAQLEGDQDRAIGLARAATREKGVAPQPHAMALQQEARTYAWVGAERECLRALDKAHKLVDDIAPHRGEEYQLASWFGAHDVVMERAACCVELGRPHEALALHEQGKWDWSPHCRWGLGVHLGRMAIAHAKVGDLEQAAAVGSDALALLRDTGSLLITSELRRLNQWATTPAIATIVDALDQTA